MSYLSRLEKERNIILPDIYKEFYNSYSWFSMPEKLVGTDLFSSRLDLSHAAIELFEEIQVDNFLEDDDFVFMMHQGYIFWYFKANGDEDPMVYSYHEYNLSPDKDCLLSEFIKRYT